MAETLQFELVSPEKLLMSDLAEMVVVPGSDGDFGALPDHSPMISTIRPGFIDVFRDGKIVEQIFVTGGFAEVNNTSLTVLAEEAVFLKDITPEFAEGKIASAEEALRSANSPGDRLVADAKLAAAYLIKEALSRKAH